MRRHSQDIGAALVAITAVAAGLRFATLDVQSFWADEAFTVSIARTPLEHLMHAVSRTESTPPVYYALAWAWGKLFGTGEAGLRSLSALLGTATVPLIHEAGRLALSRRAGLFAAGLAAVSPLLVWYSQEARAYALLVFLTVLGLVLFLRALQTARPRVLVWWAVVSALALGTHYFAAFTILPEFVVLLARLPEQRRATITASLIPATAAIALAPLLLYQREHVPRPWTGSFTVADQSAATFQEFLVGHRWTWLIHRPAVALLGVLFAAGMVLAWRGAAAHERRILAICAGIAATTFAVPAALSLVGSNYLAPRNVLAALPLLLLLVGAGLASTSDRRAGLVAGVVAGAVSAAIVVAGVTTPRLQRDDWRGLADVTRSHPGARLVVVGDRFNNSRVARLYIGSDAAADPALPVSEVLVITRRQAAVPVTEIPGFTAGPQMRLGDLLYTRFSATAPTTVPAAAIGDAAVLVQPSPSVQSGGS